MIIQKKRIRNLERHLPDNFRGQELCLGIVYTEHNAERIKQAGFPVKPVIGDRILPTFIGPVTRFNAEGKMKIRRDLPMETAYRQVEWHWTEWHGKEEVERSDFKDVPYQRYPREFIPPPSVEVQAVLDNQGRLLIVTDPLLYENAGSLDFLHAMNVCLELFGECEVFTLTLASTTSLATHRLNWQILPAGKYPWEKVRSAVQPIIDRAKKGHIGAIVMRLETVSGYEPEFVAIGTAGFHGYIIFGFPSKPLFILESAYYGNATYVFDRDWETLSRLTKAEILDQSLQKDRLVHLSGWPLRLGRLFGKC
ncbi:MAG: hypothetical protein NT023_05855 [Armatimonadetes bacterium]|nr:hypothetical protein [Armatimonadota bacterium]